MNWANDFREIHSERRQKHTRIHPDNTTCWIPDEPLLLAFAHRADRVVLVVVVVVVVLPSSEPASQARDANSSCNYWQHWAAQRERELDEGRPLNRRTTNCCAAFMDDPESLRAVAGAV